MELLGGLFDQPSQFFLLGSDQEGLPFGLIGDFVRLGAGREDVRETWTEARGTGAQRQFLHWVMRSGRRLGFGAPGRRG
jgi:hypothetical protein